MMQESKNISFDEEKKDELQRGGLKERLGRVKKSRWVRFAIVSVLFFAWVIWLGTWWVGLFWFLLADIYLTQFIPWTWWRHTKYAIVKEIMTWVDAIVYALILVYFLFAFVGQNYQIPSSSLEKSLLVGDYLWVNKMVYGPRVPNTLIHFPLVQNTFPILNCKSYLEKPQLDYHRLKGYRSVRRNDIVVFNFPAGDTVALLQQNPDYYTLCELYGRDVVQNNKAVYGEIIYRPVDRRENYVKRCIGLPGENLKIVNDEVYINGKKIANPKNVQFNYYVQTNGTEITEQVWEDLGVSVDDRIRLSGMETEGYGIVYVLPLTAEMREKLNSYPWVTNVAKVPTEEQFNPYPITRSYGWTRADYGSVWIPKKGESIALNMDNLPIYERCIKNYEGNALEVKDGKIYINGELSTSYTFKMDYYWMMGDNRDNSLDSRYWGFVPEDHIVGTPMVVLISLDKDKGFPGIRWNRIFRDANPE